MAQSGVRHSGVLHLDLGVQHADPHHYLLAHAASVLVRDLDDAEQLAHAGPRHRFLSDRHHLRAKERAGQLHQYHAGLLHLGLDARCHEGRIRRPGYADIEWIRIFARRSPGRIEVTERSDSTFNTPSASPGCGFATANSRSIYANELCFADFTNYNFTAATTGTCSPPGLPTQAGQLYELPIDNTPYTLSFCLQVTSSANNLIASVLPTYYNPSGDDSEAFLGNNGFYTGTRWKTRFVQDQPPLRRR